MGSSHAIQPDHKYPMLPTTSLVAGTKVGIYLQKKTSKGPAGKSRRDPPRPRGSSAGGGGTWGLRGLDSPRDSAASRTIRLREKF